MIIVLLLVLSTRFDFAEGLKNIQRVDVMLMCFPKVCTQNIITYVRIFSRFWSEVVKVMKPLFLYA